MRRRKNIPRTKSGLAKYIGKKGFRKKPLLAGTKAEDLWFTKPIPNDKQIHVRIWLKGRKNVKIEKHIDRSDPYRNPLGHLIADVANPIRVPHKRRYLPKKRN